MLNRNQFMKFFRDEDTLNNLSAEDRKEIFKTILQGSSDITAELLNGIIADYNVQDLEVLDLSDKIRIVWCVEDVISIAKEDGKNVSREQAFEILKILQRDHDCNYGITNETIQDYLY